MAVRGVLIRLHTQFSIYGFVKTARIIRPIQLIKFPLPIRTHFTLVFQICGATQSHFQFFVETGYRFFGRFYNPTTFVPFWWTFLYVNFYFINFLNFFTHNRFLYFRIKFNRWQRIFTKEIFFGRNRLFDIFLRIFWISLALRTCILHQIPFIFSIFIDIFKNRKFMFAPIFYI